MRFQLSAHCVFLNGGRLTLHWQPLSCHNQNSGVALQIDKKMEDALRHTVKRSLQEMSRVLNGDNKTEVVPVFTVTIVLGKTNRVELKPTVQVRLAIIQNLPEFSKAVDCHHACL